MNIHESRLITHYSLVRYALCARFMGSASEMRLRKWHFVGGVQFDTNVQISGYRLNLSTIMHLK